MNPEFLYYHNDAHLPLERAVDEAAAAFVRRTQLPPTQVVLPVGDWPATVGKLEVVTDARLGRWFMEVHTAYIIGDIVCMECSEVLGNNPAIQGVSHGLCLQCKAAALAEFEATLAERHKVRQLELI